MRKIAIAIAFTLSCSAAIATDSVAVKTPGKAERFYNWCHAKTAKHPKIWGTVKGVGKFSLFALEAAGSYAQASRKKVL